MAREYPKEVKLKDGTTIVLRPFEKKDKDALLVFFQKMPEAATPRRTRKSTESDPREADRR